MVYYILPFYHFTHIQNHPQVEDWEGKNCKKHTSLLVFVIPLLLWWSCGCTCFEHRHSLDKGFALPLFLVTLDTSTLALEQPTLDWKDSPPDRFWWHLNIRHATFMWIMAQWHGSLASHCQQPEILNRERRTGGLKEAISFRSGTSCNTWLNQCHHLGEYDHSTATHRHIDTDFGSESKAKVQRCRCVDVQLLCQRCEVHSVRPC